MNRISENKRIFTAIFVKGDDGRLHENCWRFRISSKSDRIAEAVRRMKGELPNNEVLSSTENMTILIFDDHPPRPLFLARSNKKNLDTLYDNFENFESVRQWKVGNIRRALKTRSQLMIHDSDYFQRQLELARSNDLPKYIEGVHAKLGKWEECTTAKS